MSAQARAIIAICISFLLFGHHSEIVVSHMINNDAMFSIVLRPWHVCCESANSV